MKKLFFLSLIAAVWGMSALGNTVTYFNDTPYNINITAKYKAVPLFPFKCSSDDFTLRPKHSKYPSEKSKTVTLGACEFSRKNGLKVKGLDGDAKNIITEATDKEMKDIEFGDNQTIIGWDSENKKFTFDTKKSK